MGRPVTLPAPKRRRKANWDDATASARKYPGEWIKVKGVDGADVELSITIPNQIRRGRYSIDPEEFEVTRRSEGCEPGKAILFIRYVG